MNRKSDALLHIVIGAIATLAAIVLLPGILAWALFTLPAYGVALKDVEFLTVEVILTGLGVRSLVKGLKLLEREGAP